jgi:predicted kinase
MIHLIVGNTGAGKTTYSIKLKEQLRAVRFSIDQWNKTLFLPDKKESDGLDWFLERIERSEKMMMELILQLENSGVDSILDLGLSKYEHREKFRTFARENGIETKLHFLDIDKDTRLRRVQNRNIEKGETFEFEVSQEDFDFMEGYFESPGKEELKGAEIIKS